MNIFFVRHGKTVWNVEGKIQGWEDSPLVADDNSPELAASQLKGMKFDYICSSDIKRAITTKERILKILDIKDEKNEHSEFREVAYGEIEGLPLTYVLEKYGDVWRNYKLFNNEYDPGKYIKGFESVKKAKERVYKKLDALKKIYGENSNILIVSHGALISIIQNDGIKLKEPLPVPANGSVTKIIY